MKSRDTIIKTHSLYGIMTSKHIIMTSKYQSIRASKHNIIITLKHQSIKA